MEIVVMGEKNSDEYATTGTIAREVRGRSGLVGNPSYILKIRYALIPGNRAHQKGPENIERKGENARAESSRRDREFISLRGCHDSIRMLQGTRG